MLVEQVDTVSPQALHRSFGNLADLLGAAIQSDDLAVPDFKAKLSRNDDFVAERRNGITHQFFVAVRTIGFGRVEKVTPRS
jgi:hypothetical protein